MKNNNLETHTYILPEYWASALINDDTSGMEDKEIEEMNSFLAKNNLPSPVSCSEEAYFSWRNDSGNNLGGNVLEYYFLLPAE